MELNQLTLIEALNAVKSGKTSSKEITQACLNRIAATEENLHAFITVNKKCKQEVTAGPLPLEGIPVAIKDNFNTKNLKTTAASKILDNYIPPYDATVVRDLKNAGAVILGKTNMDAFAHGSSTETSDFGTTSNPWDTSRLPGGSSGGSAAAVAADQTIFAIGSETAGSIRQPAAWCGVVGFKPTYGRISRYGLIAMASSTDSPGPITKTVADAALVYNCLAGFDFNDATTSRQVSRAASLKVDLKKVTIGLPKEYFRQESQKGVNETIQSAAKVLEKLGAKLVDISLFDPQYAISVYTILQRSEVSSNLARFDGLRFGHDRSFFNEENRRRIMLGTYALSAGYYDAYYKKAQQVRTIIVNDFLGAFEKVDLVLGPTSPSTALEKGATTDEPMFGELQDIFVEPSSIAGLPGINVPCGFINGLPVGMQIFGPQWSEDLILGVAKEYESHTDWHTVKPKL